MHRNLAFCCVFVLLLSACATTPTPATTTQDNPLAAQLPDVLPPAEQAEEAAASPEFSSAENGLQPADLPYYQNTTQRALETGRLNVAAEWQNSDSGNSGSVKPLRNLQLEEKACREFEQQLKVNGETHSRKAIACRNADASWSVQ